jgi:hypothetical protein
MSNPLREQHPDGLCGCGCGESVATGNRFVRGHQRRLPLLYIETVTDYKTPCWVWLGRIEPNGYGKRGKQWAHRISYERKYGPIPAGLDLDHLCRVPCCVNPDHLEPVTRSENNRRGVGAKLTAADVATIRSADGSHAALARRYGVAPWTINRIRRGEKWASA